jgi:hypothetical protein
VPLWPVIDRIADRKWPTRCRLRSDAIMREHDRTRPR